MASCHIRARTTEKGKRRFDVRYRTGGRYSPMLHAGTFQTRKDAEARRAVVSGWLAAGMDPKTQLRRLEGEGRLFAQVADDWLKSRRAIGARTRVEYERRLAVVKERFPGRPEDIAPGDVREWTDELSERLKPATVGLYVTTLRMVLDHSEVEPNPARHRSVELPRVQRVTLEPPDADEVLAVVTALTRTFRPVVVLLEQTAFRVTEACVLQPADVEEGRVRVRAEQSKTRTARWTPCPPWLTGLLEPPFGVNRQTVHNALKRACKDAGVAPFGPHMLRHRRASLWHQQHVVHAELAARLGHSRPTMSLERYAHVKRLHEIPAQRLEHLLR